MNDTHVTSCYQCARLVDAVPSPGRHRRVKEAPVLRRLRQLWHWCDYRSQFAEPVDREIRRRLGHGDTQQATTPRAP